MMDALLMTGSDDSKPKFRGAKSKDLRGFVVSFDFAGGRTLTVSGTPSECLAQIAAYRKQEGA